MLLMNRVIRTKVPAVIRAPTSKVHKEARQQEKEEEGAAERVHRQAQEGQRGEAQGGG